MKSMVARRFLAFFVVMMMAVSLAPMCAFADTANGSAALTGAIPGVGAESGQTAQGESAQDTGEEGVEQQAGDGSMLFLAFLKV